MADDFRLANYLARIGVRGPVAPDYATLAALQLAQVDAIPFEGLDPLLGRPVKLDLVSLQAKLVDGRRGGYCFELNALLMAALEAIGFRVAGLGGRVRWMSPTESPLGPRTHMALKVDLPDGPYLVDAGFGACLMDKPMPLTAGAEESAAVGTYRLSEFDGMFLVSARQPSGWRAMYAFNLEPQLPADYALANYFTSTNPLAPFVNSLIMERVSGGKRLKLLDRRFTVEGRDGERVDERTIASAAELQSVLDRTFNVAPPAPIDQLFARIGG